MQFKKHVCRMLCSYFLLHTMGVLGVWHLIISRHFFLCLKTVLAASFRTVMFAYFGCSLISYQSLKIKFTEEPNCHWRTPAMNTKNGIPKYFLSVPFHYYYSTYSTGDVCTLITTSRR